MRYVIVDRNTHKYRQAACLWTDDLDKAEIVKTTRVRKSWWFNIDVHILIPVTITLTPTGEQKMGYTHYWNTTEFKEQQWDNFCESAKKVIVKAVANGIMVDRESDDEDTPPLICDSLIALNGRGEEGHETFYFQRENTTFQFCKTAHKPYDTVAVALLILAHHYDNDFVWESDGKKGDMNDGVILIREALPLIGIEELGLES